jgi:ribosomal protein S18 acetylase RimI-like enzyme/membrane protease YdiL (CAAX protease family)
MGLFLFAAMSAALSAPAFRVTRAADKQLWSASSVMQQYFGGAPVSHLTSLKVPWLTSNVFFRPIDDPLIAVATSGEEVIGCAQLLHDQLRDVVGDGTGGRNVAFIQSVAVAPAHRRKSVGTEMMAFCEAKARDTWATEEAWLAVAVGNDAALSLYDTLGYVQHGGAVMNNLLLRKALSGCLTIPSRTSKVVACASADTEANDCPEAVDARTDVPLRSGVGLKPLLSNLAIQSLYGAVAVLGITVLLAPFGGPSAAGTLGLDEPWQAYPGALGHPGAWWAVAPEVALGSGVAVLELARQGVLGELFGGSEGGAGEAMLDYTPAQATQMRPLYEIAAREPVLPIAASAIAAWQLTIALAEELYYRGFVQSAGVLAVSYPLRALGGGAEAGGAVVLLEGLPLLVSAALFGLVHAEFVEGAAAGGTASEGAADGPAVSSAGVRDDKAYWFRVTGAYGALYSALYVLSGHRLLAPTFAHAGMNVGLCLRDWRRMRQTPAEVLRRTFDGEMDD